MKSPTRIFTTLLLLTAGSVSSSIAQTTPQQVSPEIAKNWSLFSEYQRNGDHVSAVPYGWTVVRLDPAKFKTLYQKLGECYFSFYEKATGDAKKAYADTIVMVNDLGIKHVPDRAAPHWLHKAYALENYFEATRDMEAIGAYEKSFALDFKTPDFAYIDRLGQLYVKHMSEDPSFKEKAVTLYQRVADERANDAQDAYSRIRPLISDPKELVEIAKKRLDADPENIERIWEYIRACMQAEMYAEAERSLLKLTKKVANNATYWNELAKAQQRQRKFKEAIDSYERALKLNTALKENFLNISLCYRELKNYTQARTYTERAAASDKGWGRPYIERGEIYKSAVEDCVKETKGGDWAKLDINDKLVYKLAQEAFARAKATEPGIANEANQLSNALGTLVPTKADYFFNKDRIKNGKMEVQGACYEWIKELVTVPAF